MAGAFLGSIYATLELKTAKFSGAVASSKGQLATIGGAAGKTAKAFAPIGLAAGAALTYAGVQAGKFESRMADVSTLIAGDSTQAVNTLKDGILAMAKEIPKSPDELGASAYAITSAGITDASEALKVLESSAKLAVAGLGTTEEATNLMTSSINSFSKEGLSADQISNILFKTVKNGKTTVAELSSGFGAVAGQVADMGIPMEDFMSSVSALTTVGMPASQAYTSLKAVMSGLTRETETSKKVFGELGVKTFKELIAKTGGIGKAMQAVKGAVGDNDAEMLKLVGSTEALSAIQSISGPTAEAYANTLADMKDESYGVEQAFQKQKETAENSFKLLKNQVETSAISIGSKLLPMVTTMVDFLINNVAPALAQMADFLGRNKIILAIVGGIIGAVLVTAFVSWAIAAGAAALATLATLAPIILIGAVIGAVAYLIFTHWETIKNAFSVAWDFIKGVFSGAWEWLKSNWDIVLGVFTGGLGLLVVAIYRNWDKITAFVGGAFQLLKDYANFAWNFIKSGASILVNAVVAYFNFWKNTAIGIFNFVKNTAVNIFNNIKDTVTGVIQSIIGVFQTIKGAIGNAMGGVADTVTSPFKSAFNAIARFWNNTVGSLSFEVPSWVPGMGGKGFSIPKIPMLASGGIVSSPTLAMIGEGSEKEAVMPLSKLASFMQKELPTMRTRNGGSSSISSIQSGQSMGGQSINIEKMELPNVKDASDFARQIQLKFQSTRGV